MALDLTGIDNRGEFYSHHYLDALLEGDLRPLLQRWGEAEDATPPVRAPHKVLNGLAGRWFAARSQVADGVSSAVASWKVARGVHADLLAALGYERRPLSIGLEDGSSVPLVLEVRRGGNPTLWVLETGFPTEADSDPLDQSPLPAQLPEGLPADARVPELTWRQLLDEVLFRRDDAPAWVLFLGGDGVVLTHRHKWSRGKALAFDLAELYARRQPAAFRAMAGLLHAEALCPAEGTSLHDNLEESSHKHAFAVSTDLREGAQEAIELLGNEAVHYLRTVRKKGAFGTSETAEQVDATKLTRECLIWLYRLIFLFYVESRSDELGVAPMKSEAYRRGYSLESLRALETVPLTTLPAQEGSYLDASLRQLFALVNDGHPKDAQLALEAGIDTVAFRIHGLKSRLFDDAETPILAKVRLRNVVVQRVIERLSLSREGRHKERGRISYASLGINQLGAVYEGLLAYTGFFAAEDLIEVANAGENGTPDARTFFVPARDRERYEEGEIVRDPKTGARAQHPRGTFLFRLAGRDREKSASYYTPEVLTRCLVKYTLRERIGTTPADESWVAADALLDLTICEPAMGSGAFLNEVVNQLAEAYLQRKQAEIGQTIESDRYPLELQRVKARIAAQSCYGVDLNPLAAELGKVSLWLNVLRAGAPAPFFDARLAVGNSLVGARRAGYTTALLRKSSKKTGDGWMDTAPDEWREQRPADGVYHFLLPAAGMAAFDGDKVVKALVPEAIGRVAGWRKGLGGSFTATEKERLVRLSEVVDRLWAEHASNRAAALEDCSQAWPVWPEEDRPGTARRDEEHLVEAWKRHEARNSAGRRLKEVMDRWCALWFWPVLQAELLPSRGEWLDELEAALVGSPRADLGTATDPAARRARVVAGVVGKHHFLHWEWQFPEVLGKGGFDVVVGNPPWVKLQWNEGGILSDLDPRIEIRRMSAKAAADARAETLSQREGREGGREVYLKEFVEFAGQQSFLNAVGNYALLQGVQTNLYKAFIVLMTNIGRTSGLIHQKGVFDDPNGGHLRAHLAPRMRWHFHFSNKLLLFEAIKDEKHYELSIFASVREPVSFGMMSNLLHPRTIEESMIHDGVGEVPGLRTDGGDWDLRGHRARVLNVDQATLSLFASLYDEPGTPGITARLPVLHARGLLEAMQHAASAKRLGPNGTTWDTTREWHEGDRTKDNTIRKVARPAVSLSDCIISGPQLYVANPYYKDPNIPCQHNQDYSPIDHQLLTDAFCPRTTYERACSTLEYTARIPRWNGVRIDTFFRWVARKMLAPTGERTLISAIHPPGPMHINGCIRVRIGS